jgi:hypothetical protein
MISWINESQTNEFYLWLPLEHDYIYEYVPKFAFVEFLNYIAGIISVWFGISVFSLTTHLFSFFKRTSNWIFSFYFNQFIQKLLNKWEKICIDLTFNKKNLIKLIICTVFVFVFVFVLR